jgi:hypothetical protein
MEYENLIIYKLNTIIMPYVKIERYGQYIRCAITNWLTGNGKDNNDYLAYDNIHELLFGSQYRFSLFYVMTEVWLYALPTQMVNTLKFIQPSVSIEELLIKLDLYIA